MIRGVIFDLGSTLIYSDYDNNWEQVFLRMRADLFAHLRAAGYRLDEADFLRRLAARYAIFDQQRQTDWKEYTSAYLITATLAEVGAPAPSAEVLTSAIRAYYAYSESLWREMPGVHAVLRGLAAAGLKLGIISNAADDGNVQRLIDQASLRGYFDPIIVSAAVGWRKPNPKIFEMVLEPWRLAPDECVMVGDTLGADILGAQLSGLHNVWITARADHPANAAHRGTIHPEARIEHLPELPGVLAHLNGNAPS
jgi:putative hydrolase of the HAD superfamily